MTSWRETTPLDYHAYLIRGGSEAFSWLKERFAQEKKKRLALGESEPEFVVREKERWTIDDSREFRELQLLRWHSGQRWLVIVCREMLPEAEQALLKTLEEPTASVQMFVILPQPEKLLPTTKSRCQILDFGLSQESDLASAKKFLSASRGERLGQVDKIMSGDDNRSELENLLSGLEKLVAQNRDKNNRTKFIEHLLAARGWLRRPHVSPKFVAQFLAVVLPRYSK